MNQVTLHRHAHHIGGKEVQSADGGEFISTNPATGTQWGSFANGTAADVERAVSAAQTAFGDWSRMSPTKRGRLMMRWADAIRQNAERIGTLETTQNGKILRDSVGQASMLPEWLYYYGGLADKIEGSVIPIDQRSILNYTNREPLGVVGIITPWNSPAMLTTFAAAPALAAGNTIVIKPSEIASASLLELARLAESAGIPAGVINVVTGARQTSEALIDHPQVARIAFTGSVEGGRAVLERASRRLVGCTLELGGKSPQLVFADADLQQAEAGILGGIFSSTGQTCVAGSRAYIHRKVHDELVSRLIERAQSIRIGDPMLPKTQMGPVATLAQLDKNQRLVKEALDDGASLLTGGKRIESATSPGGFFFEPTVLGAVQTGNRILHTEAFGPILAVVPFDDEEEAVGLANASEFGLGAGIWTNDIKRAHRVAARLQVGTVWINMYRTLGFNSPVTGRKQSGLGVQNGQEAILQYLQTKSVWCEIGDGVSDQFAA